MLSLENCSIHYGSATAVAGASFSVGAGEIVALVGANGAGKSSIIKAIAGLVKAAGSVLLDGQRIDGLPSHKRIASGIGVSPEGRHVFTAMTVRDNLDLGYPGRDKTELDSRVERMYGLFPKLGERRTQLAGSMSGGEQQMLAIARALMSNPKVLLLDEPTLGLAPIIVEQLVDLMTTLKADGLSILLSEQNAEMALRASDRAYVIETGTITRTDLSSVLSDDPAIQSAYLGL